MDEELPLADVPIPENVKNFESIQILIRFVTIKHVQIMVLFGYVFITRFFFSVDFKQKFIKIFFATYV
jgi:hypothetical protein